MTGLDLVVLGFAALLAVRGAQQGFVEGVVSLIGFVVGAIVGGRLASDVLASDPLAGLRLTREEMAERDLYVVSEVRGRGVPLAMVLSGGYGPLSWEAHARSVGGILARFDRMV